MGLPSSLGANYNVLAKTVDLNQNDAYIHIGQGSDDLLRYLTRVNGEDKYYSFILTPEETVLGVEARYLREARDHFPGDRIVEISPDETVVEQVRSVIGESSSIGIPETTPVSIATDLESFASITVVAEPDTVWCEKMESEREILGHMANGVQYGIARAESVLAESVVDEEILRWDGKPLTTDRLRCEIRKELADYGLSDFGNIIIGAGSSCADLHFTGQDVINPNETVLIDLGPRGSFGYYGDITRTFIPGSPSEWANKIYNIVHEALQAAFETLSEGAGVTTGELYRSMAAIIESYGYETDLDETQDDAIGLTHGTGHGIGVRMHEKPFQTRDGERELAAGNVITIEPGIYDGNRGGVRLEDTVIIQEDGFENLMDYPYEITPTNRDWKCA